MAGYGGGQMDQQGFFQSSYDENQGYDMGAGPGGQQQGQPQQYAGYEGQEGCVYRPLYLISNFGTTRNRATVFILWAMFPYKIE